jgi:hypothetical protein
MQMGENWIPPAELLAVSGSSKVAHLYKMSGIGKETKC